MVGFFIHRLSSLHHFSTVAQMGQVLIEQTISTTLRLFLLVTALREISWRSLPLPNSYCRLFYLEFKRYLLNFSFIFKKKYKHLNITFLIWHFQIFYLLLSLRYLKLQGLAESCLMNLKQDLLIREFRSSFIIFKILNKIWINKC